jgi:hypothetical protein
MLPCTKEIIQWTERLTGKPVHMEEDRSLSVISHIQIARGAAPMHKLRYRPTPNGTPDYFICFQCGFIIRLYENPPEQRYDFEGSPDAPARMASLLTGNPAASQMKDRLLGGLMTQLRSMPIGMRIDDWLFRDYLELRLQQVAAAKAQLRDNARALAPEVKRQVPKPVFMANAAMNSAFALYWAKSLADDSVLLPYKSTGFLPQGEALIEIFESVGSTPSEDRKLVDSWAEVVGLNGWYRWIAHRTES